MTTSTARIRRTGSDSPRFTGSRLSGRSRVRGGVVALGAAGALVTGMAGLTAAPAQAAGTVITISTAAQFEADVPYLQAGQTLALKPGTYNVGAFRPRLVSFGHTASGTPNAHITVTAADPQRPPLIQGSLKFDSANYWNFSNLRIQGTLPLTDTLTFNGGNGWSLTNSEVFGARQTGALANVVVSKVNIGMPTNWTIAYNSIHDAGADKAKAGKEHEIYLTAVGDAQRGLIVRNLFYNTPEGASVKIGNGGLANSPGISGIQVDNNTMYQNFEQVLMHGNVSNNSVKGNLMVLSTRSQANGATIGVYLAGVTGSHNLITDNYFYKVTTPIYNGQSTGSFKNGGNNQVRGNPRFDSPTAWKFHPTTVAAQQYGRYATKNFWH